MKIVKFKGGLGNQLFQYVFLRRLELVYNEQVKADFSYYENFKNDRVRKPRIFNLNVKINKAREEEIKAFPIFRVTDTLQDKIKRKIKFYVERFLTQQYYLEKNRNYVNIDKILKYEYFDGYWQSWKYLIGIEDELKREIKLKNIRDPLQSLINDLSVQNSVFIGIRRGDYLSNKKMIKRYGIFNFNYYLKGVEIIKRKIKNPTFYVFSNDIEWVKDNMRFHEKIDDKVIYNDSFQDLSDEEELFLMAACKHAIIPNSTYYWWAAWLINNKDKIIIAPKKWFADGSPINIIPESWIKL
jgi:hypothetical protein